ncbi:hypothetical protein BJY52DRAFT_118458 [Lactarius psammicola]|nr:hypothetical protein BJY52DRAFT_118458 [Lactarius psammicola]
MPKASTVEVGLYLSYLFPVTIRMIFKCVHADIVQTGASPRWFCLGSVLLTSSVVLPYLIPVVPVLYQSDADSLSRRSAEAEYKTSYCTVPIAALQVI